MAPAALPPASHQACPLWGPWSQRPAQQGQAGPDASPPPAVQRLGRTPGLTHAKTRFTRTQSLER